MKKEKYRIAVCKDTGKKIVQVLESEPDNWLCLHRENELLDKASVDAFEAGQNFKHKP